MKHHKKTMRYKLISWFCLLNLFVLAIIGYFLYMDYGIVSKEDVRETLNEIGKSAAAQIESSLDNLEQTALDLQSRAEFYTQFQTFLDQPNNTENTKQLRSAMEQAYQNRNNIRRVILLDLDGNYLSTGVYDPDETVLAEIVVYGLDMSERMQPGKVFYYPVQRDYMEDQTQAQVLTAIAPIRIESRIQGFILIQQNISYYGNALDLTLSGYPVDMLILWREDRVLYSSMDKETTQVYAQEIQEYSNRKETEDTLISIQISSHRFLRYAFVLSKEAGSEKIQTIFQMFFILLCGVCLCTIVYIFVATHSIMRPLREITEHMSNWNFDEPQEPEIRIQTADYETEILLSTYEEMIHRQKDIHEKNTQLEQLQARTLFSALQSEISPHFILNTIGSIAEICEESGANNAAENCYSLANILRYSSGYATEEVMLGQEAENLESYLKLMKVRYRNRLNYTIQIEEKCKYLYMPKLILQPLVENSLKYAGDKTEQIDISVEALSGKEEMLIFVQDNGIGITQEAIDIVTERFNKIRDERAFQEILEQTQIGNMGLSGTLIRLKLFYGDHFNYVLEGTEKGTSIILKIRYADFI